MIVGLATVVVLVLFNRFPELDIVVSQVFFDPRACDTDPNPFCSLFPAKASHALVVVRNVLQYLPLAVAAGLGLYLVARFIKGTRLRNPGFATGFVAFWTYPIGVGILVNLILKEHWGRPRPYQTDIFGGEWPMIRAGEISNYCPFNCSFVSGEAAAAFWLVCLATLTPLQWRPLSFFVAFSFAIITSSLRVAFGVHYLSDVIFSALLIILTFLILRLTVAKVARREVQQPQVQVAPAG